MSDAQDIIDAAAHEFRHTHDPDLQNLVLENEHLTMTIDLAARPNTSEVRVIVATRYCVLPIEETEPLTAKREAQLRGWLERREELFRAYTLPALAAQQHVPEYWVLFVDTRLIHIVAPRIQADLPPWAIIVPVPPGQSSSSALDKFLYGTGADRWRVVARVDNDDAIAVDYCKALATWVSLAPRGERLLSFPIGAQIIDGIHGMHGHDRLSVSVTGHFSALTIPPGGRLNKALAYMHTEVYRGGLDVPVVQLITTQPMWVEVLHGENLANHVRPGPRLDVSPETWMARFQGRS